MGFNTSVTRTKATNVKQVVTKIGNLTISRLGYVHTTQAKLLAAVDEGQFRNSISTIDAERNVQNLNDAPGEKAQKLDASGLKKGEMYAGSNVEHAIWIEYGTRKMKAQPSIRPAAELVFTGSKAEAVMKKYNREQMERELKMRKEVLRNG